MLSASAYAEELAVRCKITTIKHNKVVCRYVFIVSGCLLAELQQRTPQVARSRLTCINKEMVVLTSLQSWIGG